jgi:Domain of unknown function (DUF932)
MAIRTQQTQAADGDTHPKWFNSPVSFHEGTLTDVRRHIPVFERRSFGLIQPDNESSRLNEHLDTIVRLPLGDDHTFIPVFDIASAALNAVEIVASDVEAKLAITEYGERMFLSLRLPDSYRFDPGDGHPMSLRLECLNSVDGSTRFRALMSWFRLVCSNGLTIGVTRSDVRRRHAGDLRLEDVGLVLSPG